MTIAIRVVAIICMLIIWFVTQKLIASRGFKGEGIQDKVHVWTAKWNATILANDRLGNGLLISSSLGIDALGIYMMYVSIMGPTITPIIGLFILFSLRQLCQYATALPAPEGMVWRDPGFPSLFVTYHVENDLFFSGHTALAVYGGIQLWTTGEPILQAIGLIIALYEIMVVLVLRAHWTMDVYAGLVTALLIDQIAKYLGPLADAALQF